MSTEDPGLDLAAGGNVAALIDTGLVARLVAEQFPQWSALPIRPVEHDGWDNRTFRLGAELSVRLPSAAGYVGQIAKEQRWLPLLAPQLPQPVPVPVAAGRPGAGYPYPWSVYRWLPGRPAVSAGVPDPERFAADLAAFLVALQAAETDGGPAPARSGGYRGGPVAFYGDECRRAIADLGSRIDGRAATRVWRDAETATWAGPPVWVHGDVAVGNLLVADQRLAAVIDFGSSSVGDPACDLVPAWTMFAGRSRRAFRDGVAADPAAWARACGWALWKSAITLAAPEVSEQAAAQSRAVIEAVLADPYAQG